MFEFIGMYMASQKALAKLMQELTKYTEYQIIIIDPTLSCINAIVP